MSDDEDTIVSDEVAAKAWAALEALEAAATTSVRDCAGRLQLQSNALRLAKAAVAMPSLLPRAHIPVIHRIAIFLPLLLPIAMNVLGTFVRQSKKHMQVKPAKPTPNVKAAAAKAAAQTKKTE